MTAYTRENPSPRYTELLGYYQEMHEKGAVAQDIPAEETFDGRSMHKHVGRIGGMIREVGAKTILDYGSGKGTQYGPLEIEAGDGGVFPDIRSYWDVLSISCYDPGYAPFSELPRERFDGVVCTDVLEHCPREDIPWLLAEIFGYATKFVFLNIACYPAGKTLPNGENAHCTVAMPEEWFQLIGPVAERHRDKRCWISFDVVEPDETGKSRIVTKTVEIRIPDGATA